MCISIHKFSDDDSKEAFYNKLDTEIKRAKTAGANICIELDANTKLGNTFIKNVARGIRVAPVRGCSNIL